MTIEIDFKTFVAFLCGVLLTLLTEFLFLSGYVVSRVKDRPEIGVVHLHQEQVMPAEIPIKKER